MTTTHLPPAREGRIPDHTATPLRVLALVSKQLGISPGQRFRLEQWAHHLVGHGITITFSSFESPELTQVLYEPGRVGRKIALTLRDGFRAWARRADAQRYDVVIVYREAMLAGGPWIEEWLRRQEIPFVFDFDDAIWESSSDRENPVVKLVRARSKVARICQLASAVTVGNEYLASFAREYSANVTIIPTTIELAAFPLIRFPEEDHPLKLVWTGSHSTLPHLDTLRPVLTRVGARLPVQLRVICDQRPLPFPNVDVEFVRWRADREAVDLGAAHVGLMPLPDNPFTRGKCACKALQYMAVGRPAIVSPVGVNTEIVAHMVNGVVADTPAQWASALEALAGDLDLCRTLGLEARRTVVNRFSAEAGAAGFARALRGAAKSAGARSVRAER